MPLLDGRFTDEFGGGGGAEFDIGFQRWLVGFKGE
jgi:hypothetical protein